ncbi:hypothetical protein A3767_17505 [Oleiphilus sp. HI0133]|nr:hypothetical protein A3767_17505 [Oleiphilus sp. HI0133]
MEQKNVRTRRHTLGQSQLSHLLSQLDHSVALVSGGQPLTQDTKSQESRKPEKFSIYSGLPLHIECNSTKLALPPRLDTTSEGHLAELPFLKGWIGAKSYSEGLDFFGYYTWSYTYCNNSGKGIFVFSDECSEEIEQTILELVNTNINTNTTHTVSRSYKRLADFDWVKSQDFNRYADAFTKLQSYILAGDCYQANLTQRFEAPCDVSKMDLIDIFFNGVDNSQANYCAFIQISRDNYLLSFSPEKFIESNHRQLVSKPIKGTVKSNGEITDCERALLLNAKNRAENLMIVDLLRNDMSKVSELNSVKVPKLFEIESYENVHHLVSTISSSLSSGISEFEAFCAVFPGGSITGAPKKRAMEIIDELEVHPRRYYCGSVFYWDYRGNFDSNILIRTAEVLNNTLYCWAGGGIVADSELASEYQESIDKIRHITGLEK